MLGRMLKPDDDEITALARREASVQHETEFRPICYGFFGNSFVLVLIVILTVFWVPFRLICRLPAKLIRNER